MAQPGQIDWGRFDHAARRAMVHRLSPREAAIVAQTFPWRQQPLDVLGAIAARPDCTICTALTIFIRGEPERFELPQEERTDADRQIFQFLLRLHATINAGAHRLDPLEAPAEPEKIESLLIPRRERPPGRPVWGLDPAVVGPALELARRPQNRLARSRDEARDMALPGQAARPGAGRLGRVLLRLVGQRRPQ